MSPLPKLLLREPDVLAIPTLPNGKLIDDLVQTSTLHNIPVYLRNPGKNAIDALLPCDNRNQVILIDVLVVVDRGIRFSESSFSLFGLSISCSVLLRVTRVFSVNAVVIVICWY